MSRENTQAPPESNSSASNSTTCAASTRPARSGNISSVIACSPMAHTHIDDHASARQIPAATPLKCQALHQHCHCPPHADGQEIQDCGAPSPQQCPLRFLQRTDQRCCPRRHSWPLFFFAKLGAAKGSVNRPQRQMIRCFWPRHLVQRKTIPRDTWCYSRATGACPRISLNLRAR